MSSSKKRVADAEFVSAYVASTDCGGVAAKLGVTASAVRSRAAKLRKAGVELPVFDRTPRKKKEIKVAELNVICSVAKTSQEQ